MPWISNSSPLTVPPAPQAFFSFASRPGRAFPGLQVSWTWHARPFTRAHLLLADMLPVPKRFRSAQVVRIAVDAARLFAADARQQLTEPLSSPTSGDSARPGGILFLPQCFHVGGQMSWEQECDVYVDVCRQLVDWGHPVVWKEHPKCSRPFLPQILQRVPSVASMQSGLPNEWPVEVHASLLGVDSCLSATSTSLFTLRNGWGLPTYTCVDRVRPFLIGADRDVARLVKRHIPSMERLFSGTVEAHALGDFFSCVTLRSIAGQSWIYWISAARTDCP